MDENKLIAWYNYQEQLKNLKKVEMNLRKEICQDIFSGKEGKSTKKLIININGKDVELVAKSTTTLSIDEGVLDSIYSELAEEERACIKFKPSLIVSKFNKLEENGLLFTAIEEKPSAPSLTMKPVKGD